MHNLTGILLMVGAMAAFALTDTLIKLASVNLSVGQIMMLMGGGGGLVFALLTRARGHAIVARDFLNRAVILRNICEIVGTLCFVTALSRADLSVVSAVIQAMPLAVTLGAALFLREPVGWRRWSAILVGFVGVLMILRPGAADFDPGALWAVGGMLALSMRDLSTRMIPAGVPTLRISAYGMAMLLPSGLILMGFTGGAAAMSAGDTALMLVAVTSGVAGYYAITAAMRTGDVAVVAPFRYARIVFALILGYLVFDDRIDGWMLAGVAVTIGAGLYSFLRERRLELAQTALSTGVPAK